MIQTVGVIGGGQLALMMAEAARSLQVELIVQTPHSSDPACRVASGVVLAPITDAQATAQLAQHCQVVTFENEFVDLATLRQLQTVQFRPSLDTLAPLLDKYEQRCYLQACGLPVPRFQALPAHPDLSTCTLDSFPVVIKVRRHGYDGQGTIVVHDQDSLLQVWEAKQHHALLLEDWIAFKQELAIIAARSQTGDVACFPIVETQQVKQVCQRVFVPAQLPQQIEHQIKTMMCHLLDQLKAVGVFAMELFLTERDEILVNEIAPRTHNSGHLTVEACQVSQFEQHLRAICDLPLKVPHLTVQGAAMINLLGYETQQSDFTERLQRLTDRPQTYLHWYGKSHPRPGRKLGHITIVANQSDPRLALETEADRLEGIWYQLHQSIETP